MLFVLQMVYCFIISFCLTILPVEFLTMFFVYVGEFKTIHWILVQMISLSLIPLLPFIYRAVLERYNPSYLFYGIFFFLVIYFHSVGIIQTLIYSQ